MSLNPARFQKEQQEKGIFPGYYLKKAGKFYFVSRYPNETALSKVCDKVLNEKTGWDYWIDYSNGVDTNGNPAWSNMDFTDSFI